MSEHNEAMKLAESLNTISAIIKFALSWDDSGQGDQYAIQWPERPKRAEGREWVKCLDQSDAFLRTQAARIAELERQRTGYSTVYNEAMDSLRIAVAERDTLRAEVQHHIVTRERLLLTLTSIHALMYPPPIKTPDGRTMVFRPNDPDPHTILQALSDRIRDIPDTIDRAIEAAKDAP